MVVRSSCFKGPGENGPSPTVEYMDAPSGGPGTTPIVPDTSYDNRILDIANELCANFGVSRRNLTVDWASSPLDRPWFVRNGRLMLNKSLRRRLSPEEWRPLLAASLVYDKRFLWKRLVGGLVFLGVACSVLAGFLWYLVLFSPHLHAEGSGILLGIFFIPIAVAAPYFKRIKLSADRYIVTELNMWMELTTVLRKINDLPLGTDRRNRLARLMWSPTVAQRLRSISLEQP